MAPGDRVDAAFYLNINEFRSRCTVQLQLLDLRPSWEPSLREREDLKKIERFLAGDGVTPQEAGAMRPVRAQCAGCWRWLDRRLPPEGETLETAYLPLLRELERCAGGMHTLPVRRHGPGGVPGAGGCWTWRKRGTSASCAAAP